MPTDTGTPTNQPAAQVAPTVNLSQQRKVNRLSKGFDLQPPIQQAEVAAGVLTALTGVFTYVAAPLDPELVKEVKARLANGESQSKVARDLKVSRPKVNELAREVPKPTVAATTIVRNVQEDYARDVRAAMPPAAETAKSLVDAWPDAVAFVHDAARGAIECPPAVRLGAARIIIENVTSADVGPAINRDEMPQWMREHVNAQKGGDDAKRSVA